MASHYCSGRCRCGAIELRLTLTAEPRSYRPRACDCDFCRERDAAYVSDAHGQLHMVPGDSAGLMRLRQGDGLADFLVCSGCDQLIAVCYRESEKLYATANSHILDSPCCFGDTVPASPRLLSAAEKVARWKQLWFSDVRIGNISDY